VTITRNVALYQLIRDAWSLRDQFDLTNVGYGKVHWPDSVDVLRSPFSYYYFLAGIVRVTQARNIVEVGTHQGGSTRALAAGLDPAIDGRIVTFDVTEYGASMFSDHPVISAFTTDANSEKAFDACVRAFGAPKADLVFIDSTHECWTTLLSFTIYSNVIRSPLVILDDITLNPEMKKLWAYLQSRYGTDNAIDATDVEPAIRTGGSGTRPGFGIVRIPDAVFGEVER
jgi:hypothetical protein